MQVLIFKMVEMSSSFWFFLIIISSSVLIITESNRLQVSGQHNIKHSIETIETVYGEIYDCVDVNKQPSLSHPTLLNHKVKLIPDSDRSDTQDMNNNNNNTTDVEFDLTTFWKLGKGCPEGSIPLRRENFTENNLGHSILTAVPPDRIDFAGIVSRPAFKTFYGAAGNIILYHPNVAGDEYSSAAIHIESVGGPFNQIVVGWTVNPVLYKDYYTRLFTKWTGRGGKGCFNLRCPGFVHTSKNIPLDYVFNPVSVKEGPRKEIDISIYQDNVGWQLFLTKHRYHVGYWPLSLFSSMQKSANSIRFGGEVYTAPGKDYSPQMGSGEFWYLNYQRMCYVNTVKIVNANRQTVDGDDSVMDTISSRCYFARTAPYSSKYGYNVFFGGTGGKPIDCWG